MKHKTRIVLLMLLALLLLPLPTSHAAVQNRGASITNILCETYTDLIRYTFDLEVWGMRNQEIVVIVWLVYTDSDYLVEFDGTAKEAEYFSDVDGNVITGSILVPEYRSTLWEGFVLEIPLSVVPPGNYDFYPHFQVQDSRGNLLRWQSHPLCSLPRPEGRSTPLDESRAPALDTLPDIGFQVPPFTPWYERIG